MAKVKVARNGVIIGDFEEAEMLNLVQDGVVKATDYYLMEEMSEWGQVFTRDWPRVVRKKSGGSEVGLPTHDSERSENPRHTHRRKRKIAHDEDAVRCPKCQSTRVKSARAIYEQGTVEWNSTGYSQRVTGAATAFRSGRSSWSEGRSQSLLAKKMTPPPGNGPGCITFFVMLAVPMLCFSLTLAVAGEPNPISLLLGLLLSGGLIWGYFSSSLYDDLKANEVAAAQSYDQTWYCTKCGEKFIAEIDDTEMDG